MSDVLAPDTTKRIPFSGREEAKSLVQTMAEQAKIQICIQGINIDPFLFDSVSFLDSVKRLVLRSRHTTVRILVHDTRINIQHDHRLIALAQQFSSSIFIHNSAKMHRDSQHTLLLVDDHAYLHCPRATQYEGTAHFYDRKAVRDWQHQFDLCWEHSEVDSSVRRLHL